MCSISGWVSSAPLSKKLRKRLATALLWYGEPRGTHSAGIFWANQTLKRAMKPSNLTQTPEFSTLLDADGLACLCHTRQPTSGGRGDADAQPFVSGPAVTVHNGMITNCAHIKQKFTLSKQSSVDSELFASYVAAYGALALPDMMKEVTGPSTIATIDRDEMFVMRNGNPLESLSLVVGEGAAQIKITIFASTEGHVMAASRYVWIIESHFRTRTLRDRQLYSMTPAGPIEIGNALPAQSYGTYAGHHGYGGGHGGYMGWGDEDVEVSRNPLYWKQGRDGEYRQYTWAEWLKEKEAIDAGATK